MAAAAMAETEGVGAAAAAGLAAHNLAVLEEVAALGEAAAAAARVAMAVVAMAPCRNRRLCTYSDDLVQGGSNREFTR